MEKIITQLQRCNESLLYFTPEDNPLQLDFAQLTLYLEDDTWTLELNVNTTEETLEELDDKKWIIFPLLENLLGRSFSENTNSDACSYEYKFDTEHGTPGNTRLTVLIIDYLS